MEETSITYLDSRWYAIADLVCVVIAGALWFLSEGQLGWWPLLIAILPWPARILKGRFPLSRTPFDWFLLLFLITALVGVWTAYDQTAAWAKFWLIIGAILLFYGLAGQPPENVWPVWGAIGILGSIITIYFLLSHNWLESPTTLSVSQSLGTRWMSLRPQLPFHPLRLYPNNTGGLIVALLPALVAFTLLQFRQRRWLLMVLAGLACTLSTIGFLLSMSRGALLALAGGFLIWLTWLVSRKLSQRFARSTRQTFSLLLLLLLLIFIVVISLFPGGMNGILQLLPGRSWADRWALSQDLINLGRDYPITGGGLASFPGLYSQYLQITPHFQFSHAHNLYLDVLIEQGIVGLIMLLAILGLSYWLLSDLKYAIPAIGENDLLHGSALAGLTIIMLHGLVDDPLYSSNGILFIFAFSGITAAATHVQTKQINVFNFQMSPSMILLAAALLLGTLAGITYRSNLQSAWHANNGAVTMTQIELDSDWPTDLWQGNSKVPQLTGAEEMLTEALKHNQNNVTAHYRLGLIALARQDFDSAVRFLTEAQQINPGHRGVQKALGYSLLWSDEVDAADKQLSSLPETMVELDHYSRWWYEQGRPELGEKAAQLLQIYKTR